MKHIIVKKAIALSALILFGAVAINAAGEQDEWFHKGNITAKTENWAQGRGSLREDSKEEEPPVEPEWENTPIGNGIGCILIATGCYVLYKKRKDVRFTKLR